MPRTTKQGGHEWFRGTDGDSESDRGLVGWCGTGRGMLQHSLPPTCPMPTARPGEGELLMAPVGAGRLGAGENTGRNTRGAGSRRDCPQISSARVASSDSDK